jgi:solute carrier family 25 (mitochondrial aspartate/glutamate transporter), member 12/13
MGYVFGGLMHVVPPQYPWKEAPREVETALTSRGEEIAKTRARNALKILLDVHGDFGRRTPSG